MLVKVSYTGNSFIYLTVSMLSDLKSKQAASESTFKDSFMID